MRIYVQHLTLLILLLLTQRPLAHAQDTHTWNDGTGGTWGTFTKWTPAGLPSSLDTARFDLNLDYTVSLIQSRQAKLLQVTGGDLTLQSSGIFAGDVSLDLEDAFISNLGELLIKRGSNDRGMILTTSDDMTVRGGMTVANGAALDNQSAVVDSGATNSTGRLTISGVGPSGDRSTWNATELTVGNLHNGVIRVEDRGLVQINGPVSLGKESASNGEIVVTGRAPAGTTSDFRSTGTIKIGELGSGTLRVEDGAFAATGGAILGSESGGRGSVKIENDSPGNPSFWIAGNLNVKRGDVVVYHGGTIRSFGATVGTDETSTVTVSGAGTGSTLGLWEAQGLTRISESADGTLNIQSGGTVNTQDVNVGTLSGGVGRINISSSFTQEQSRFQQSGDLYLGGSSSGPGGVGHLNLNTNSFARIDGTATIYANSSIVMGPGSHLIAPTIDNSNGGFFDFLRGTLNTRNYTGDLVNQEGILAPYSLGFLDGSGTGMTTIDGDYSQQPGATLAIDIDGQVCGIGYDHVNVNGEAFLGGDLQLTLLDYVPEADDSFDVLAAGNLFGAFDNVAPGERLTTTDGLGSFVVNYGANSPFSPDMIILSDFLSGPDIPGDLNLDGIVDGLDLGILLGNFETIAPPSGGELNGTDPVDGLDLGILLGNWDAQAISAASVPEPTSAALFTLALITVSATKRGRRYPCDQV